MIIIIWIGCLQYCLVEPDSSKGCSFRMPTLDEIEQHRVVVTTLGTTNYLLQAGVRQGIPTTYNSIFQFFFHIIKCFSLFFLNFSKCRFLQPYPDRRSGPVHRVRRAAAAVVGRPPDQDRPGRRPHAVELGSLLAGRPRTTVPGINGFFFKC